MEQWGPMTAAASARQNSAARAARPSAQPRSHYRCFMPLTTRWMDNDAYGHLNNVVYYSPVSYTHLTLPTNREV